MTAGGIRWASPLEPDGLLVEVVDARGEPVGGVGVELTLRVPGMGKDRVGAAVSRAPDGLARIDLTDPNEVRERTRALGLAVEPVVSAELASPTPVRVALESWPAEGTRVKLVLPPTGGLKVRLFDSAGKVVRGGRVAWWWLPADVAAARADAAYERVSSHFVGAPEGVARIGPVGLGATFQLSASAPGLEGALERGVAGPVSAGEVRRVDVDLGAPVAKLRWRVLDAVGRPLADARLWAELWTDPDRVSHPAAGPPRAHGFGLSTDAEGYAELTRAPGDSEIAPRLDLELRAPDRSAQEDEGWGFGSLYLPTSLVSGEVRELPDVHLAPVLLLLPCRVVDGAGNGIAKARLDFSQRFGETHEHRWFNHPDGRVCAADDGSFRFRAARRPLHLAVTVSAEGYESRSLEDLPLGDLAHEILLEPEGPPPPAGTLRVEVVLDEGIPFMQLLLKWRRRMGGGRSADRFPGGVMELDGLALGAYDVWIERRDGDFEVRVEGVEVRAGEATNDPRLLPLDARGTARLVRIRALQPNGEPWRRREVAVALAGGRDAVRSRTDEEEEVALVLPRSATRLLVGMSLESAVRVDLDPSPGVQPVVLAGD